MITSCAVFVPALEANAYRMAGTQNVVPVPNDIRGITATRNWILQNAKTRRVVMIDDDVRQQGWWNLKADQALRRPLDEPVWLGEFAKIFDVTEQLGLRIWGVSSDAATRSTYPYWPFRFRSYVTASCMGLVNDGRTLFDETYPVKEDYELCCRCLTEDGAIVSAQYLHWENLHWTTEGGCKDYRTQAMERDCIRRLCKQYPGLVRAVERAGTEWGIEINA